MSGHGADTTQRDNVRMYWIAGAILVVLAIIALAAYRGAKSDQAADDKADQLLSKLHKAGVERLPSKDQVVRVLGSDGGSVCEDPSSSLRMATLFSMITNGAGGPGLRPVVTDRRLLKGQLAVISVYCPDELASVQKFVDDLKTGDVVKS